MAGLAEARPDKAGPDDARYSGKGGAGGIVDCPESPEETGGGWVTLLSPQLVRKVAGQALLSPKQRQEQVPLPHEK